MKVCSGASRVQPNQQTRTAFARATGITVVQENLHLKKLKNL